MQCRHTRRVSLLPVIVLLILFSYPMRPLRCRFAPFSLVGLVALSLLLAACGSTPEAPPAPAPKGKPAAVHRSSASSASSRPPLPAVYSPPQAQAAFQRLIPGRVVDASGWAADSVNAMGVLRVPMSPENVCAVLAVIEQESSFQADPEVPNLSKIVRTELTARQARYHIPDLVLEAGLRRKSRDGRSYDARIDALRTEADVSRLYEDLASELPDIAHRYQPGNPIHTAGAMQVNVAFAEEHARSKPYPYGFGVSPRHETFTRRGGLYFGIALLLDYNAPYPGPLYRFADYNAGRFSSRNAAFQNALVRVAGVPLDADGDLLIYEEGSKPSAQASRTQQALERVAPKLGMRPAEIRRDLLLEKTEAFMTTPLWQRLFLLADAGGTPAPRFTMPQIAVQSPKFHRTLTSSGYASQVNARWSDCMARQQAGRPG